MRDDPTQNASYIFGSVEYDVSGKRLDRDIKYSIVSYIPENVLFSDERFYLMAVVNVGWQKQKGGPQFKEKDYIATRSNDVTFSDELKYSQDIELYLYSKCRCIFGNNVLLRLYQVGIDSSPHLTF